MAELPTETVQFNILPVTEMTINQLETELEITKPILDIFKGSKDLDDVIGSSVFGEVIAMYEARMREVENELFERKVLLNKS